MLSNLQAMFVNAAFADSGKWGKHATYGLICW